MHLQIISSGSQGNAYLLKDSNNKSLLVECGISFKKIKQALDFDLTQIVGALISHEHL